MRRAILFFAAFIIGVACKPDEPTVATSPDQLTGDWRLVKPASAYSVTLRLTPGQGAISGHAGFRISGQSSVNSYSALADVSRGPSLDSGPLGSGGIHQFTTTFKSGPTEAMQFEDAYYQQLQDVRRFEQVGQNQLRLSSGQGQYPTTMDFVRQ